MVPESLRLIFDVQRAKKMSLKSTVATRSSLGLAIAATVDTLTASELEFSPSGERDS